MTSPDESKRTADRQEDYDKVRELSAEALDGDRSDVAPVLSLNNDLYRRDMAQDIELKRNYANLALKGVGVQLGIADAAFVYYLIAKGGNTPAEVMTAWLSATVVQVVGVVLVITRYLFSGRNQPQK